MIHIVLFEPEIPQNTGNIMRTCAATNTILHLIRPYGFTLDEKHLRRAAMDYYQYVTYFEYDSFADFMQTCRPENIFFFTRYGQKKYSDINTTNQEKDYYFVFGKESQGIPKEILQDYYENCIRLPMNGSVRSLNLANCAAIMIYDALRQQDFPQLLENEPEHFKGKNWILDPNTSK